MQQRFVGDIWINELAGPLRFSFVVVLRGLLRTKGVRRMSVWGLGCIGSSAAAAAEDDDDEVDANAVLLLLLLLQ